MPLGRCTLGLDDRILLDPNRSVATEEIRSVETEINNGRWTLPFDFHDRSSHCEARIIPNRLLERKRAQGWSYFDITMHNSHTVTIVESLRKQRRDGLGYLQHADVERARQAEISYRTSSPSDTNSIFFVLSFLLS